MGIPVSIQKLAIIQARMGSQRLPGKVLLPIGPETLIERVHRLTCEAFGKQNTVVAYPDTPENAPLVKELDRIGAQKFGWDGPENDVLGRFFHCAHFYRWHPSTVLMRITPDDPWKNPAMMRRVANGERLPVELGGEAFTLAQLDEAHREINERLHPPEHYCQYREHLTYLFFPTQPPPAPHGIFSIDTREQYEAVCRLIQHPKDCACQDCTLQNPGPSYGRGTGDISDPQMGELHDIPENYLDLRRQIAQALQISLIHVPVNVTEDDLVFAKMPGVGTKTWFAWRALKETPVSPFDGGPWRPC